MVIYKRKIIFSIVIMISLLLIGVVISFNTKNNNKGNDIRISVSIDNSQKNSLNYNYEIPTNIRVLDIISENELLVEQNNQLITYDLNKKTFDKKLTDRIEDDSIISAKIFNDGVIWIENSVQEESKIKICIKYFSDNKITILDECDSEILPSISLTSKYLTYYICNDGQIDIKIFNLQSKYNKTIATYELGDENNMRYVSTPNTNDFDVTWSCSKENKSQIYIYNILDSTTTEILTENEFISGPIIKNNRIFAIKRYDYFDEELNCDYASDYIVEYNNDSWEKFSKDNIENYILYPIECVTSLSTNQGLMYWTSTFDVSCLYDVEDNKFLSLNKFKDDLQINIEIVKDNIVYYKAQDHNGNHSKFIYIL